MGNPQRITLLSPGSVKGFMSARSPLALPPGYVSELNDVRLEDGTVKIRDGGLVILGSIAGDNVLRGVFECVQNGVPTIFWAGRDSGHTSVYRSIDAGMTWTLVTPTSGAYGDTRFSSEGWVRFALVSQGGTDYVVMQNGVDSPRICDGSTSVPIGSTVASPLVGIVTAGLGPHNLGAAITFVNSSARLTAARTVKGGSGYVRVSVANNVAPGDTAIIDEAAVLSVPPTVPTTLQMCWLVDSGDESWRSLKIEAAASTAGPWYKVYDPATDSPIAVPGVGTVYLAAVETGAALFSALPSGANALRLSWVGDPPATATTIELYTVEPGGNVPGGAAYGAGYASSVLPQALAGTVYPVVPTTVAGIDYPISPLIRYVYSIRFPFNPATQPAQYDRIAIYRNDYGSTGYYRLATIPFVANSNLNYSDRGNGSVDYSYPIPRADALPVPIGQAMESVNGRLFVGSGDRLYYSEAGRPFQFARNVAFSGGQSDPDSAGSFSKPGETFQAVVGIGQVITGPESTGNPLSGAVSLYALTDRKTYVMSGYDALSLNKTTAICIGTRSPYSVARSNGGFYFLDSERQIRRIEGAQSVVLSKNVVDDRTKGIPDSLVSVVWGCFLDGRYRMGYGRPTDTQNTRILVFSETLGGFESIDRPFSPPPSALLPYYDAAQSRYRLFGFGSTGMVELDVPGATLDAGPADIVARIVFPELSGATKESGTLNLTFGAGWLVTDAVAGGTATLSVLGSANRVGPTVYPPMRLDPRATGATKVATTTVTNAGAQTLTAQPALDVAALGGTRVHRFEIDAHPGSEAAQR